MNQRSKIYIAGHRELVGSAIVKNLQEKAYTSLLYRIQYVIFILISND